MIFLKKRILNSYPEWWRDGPCEARQPVMSYQRHYVGAKFRGMRIHFREMRKNNYLFGYEEVFLFLD
jgi:hypothetical protein